MISRHFTHSSSITFLLKCNGDTLIYLSIRLYIRETKLAKTIRLTESTYRDLVLIKKELEQEATNVTGAPMTMTFDDLIQKICQIYRKRDDS